MSITEKSLLCLFVLCAVIMLAAPSVADTGLARHKKMYAVPAPRHAKNDGKLTGWDLSAMIHMYVVSETSDMQSAKCALMYDKDALYIGAIVRDPSPMMNRHDPKVDGDKGWDADSCQFRIALDPKLGYPVKIGWGNGDMANPNIVHLTLWYYTDNRQPCLQMHSSMNFKSPRPEWAPFGVVPAKYFQANYVKMDDGRGYTFSYRIPWSTLGAKAPLQGGDLVAGTVQFNWGRPDGLHTAGGSAWCYDVMAGPGFPYQNTTCWGKIIFSEKGHLAKELVEEGLPPVKPLPLKFSYTLPEESQVSIQLMDKDNMVRRILVAQGDRHAGENVEMWDGLDDQGSPLPAGDYTWKGIYHQPIKQQFLFSPHNSGQPPYKTDDGTGAWGGDHGTPQDACAFPGGMILAWNVAEAGYGIIRTDLNGKKLWGSNHCATYVATDGAHLYAAGDEGFSMHGGVEVLDIADSRPLNFGNGSPNLLPPPGGDAKLDFVSGIACADGLVYVSFQQRNLLAVYDAQSGVMKTTWTVPAPGRLAPLPHGAGLAVISAGKVVAVKDGVVTPLASTHLDDPRGIAVAPDGTLYVANAGKLQNISVFGADGAYQRGIGKEGGRPQVGAYDVNGLLEPGGMTLDANGHLWVAEVLDSPKRISIWDAKSGAFVNEFFGACSYFGYSYIDPKHADEIYCHNVLWKIDWAKNSCKPVSTVWRPTTPNMMQAPGPAGYNEHPRYFTAKNGKQYCFGNASFISVLSIRDGDLYKPIMAFITLSRGYVYFPGVQFELMKDEAKYPNGSYFWQDSNNDQVVQENELTHVTDYNPNIRWVDGDLNIWLSGGKILRPVSFTADGRPQYDWNKREETFLSKNGHGGGEIWLDPTDGGVYTRDAMLAKWSADGKLLWAFPHMREWPDCLSLPMQAPGRLWGLTNPLGVAGDLTGMSCYFGSYHLITRDGIYLAMLMRDSRDGKGLGADVTASETCTGQIVTPEGMPNRYFLLAGASDARVTEIFGLDTVKPLPGGVLALSDAEVKLAADALTDYNAKLARGKRLFITRGREALDSADPITKTLDAGRGFTTRAAYDAQNLYLSFDVTSPYELVNSAPDPHLLFKGGNCLDIQLAADPSADAKRTTPAPGDVRVLVTRQNGKPFTVIYRPKLKGFAGQPIVLNSPTGKEPFDAIESNTAIGLDYRKSAAGFTAVVTIPQALLGLALKPGEQLKIDLGILYGNTLGNQVSARSYWMNNSFSANITNDVPNESRLEPGEWGTAVVE